MAEIFRLSLRDFWTRKFILLSILPLLLSIVFFSWLLLFGGSELTDALKAGAQSGDFSFLDETRFPLIASLLSFGVTKWIIATVFYLLGAFLALLFSVILAVIVAGFFTPIVAREINARHYGQSIKEEVSSARVIGLSLGAIWRFLLFFIVCLPLVIFVPFVNLIILNLPLFYIYYKLLLIDVGSNTLNAKRFELAWLEGGGVRFKLACACFYIASLVPLVGLFFQLFFIIFLSHLMFRANRGEI